MRSARCPDNKDHAGPRACRRWMRSQGGRLTFPDEPVDRHHGPSSLKAAPGSEVLLCFSSRRGPGWASLSWPSLSFSRGTATSALRVPRHEWNASSGGRCTRETTTSLEWNGPRGFSTDLAQEWSRFPPGPLQGSVRYQGCSYLLRQVVCSSTDVRCPARVSICGRCWKPSHLLPRNNKKKKKRTTRGSNKTPT